MSIYNHKRKTFKNIENTGYSAGVEGRLVNKDGTNNLLKKGILSLKNTAFIIRCCACRVINSCW